MNLNNEVVIIIPSLNPDNKLLTTVENIYNGCKYRMLIINDGSSEEYNKYFDVAREKFNCTILKHSVNQGKGRALKTAFNHILNEYPDCKGGVTVDADGQHSVEDTIKCAEKLLKNQQCLVMGCREFKKENIPFRSRFGNVLTCKIVNTLCGIKVSDTQTGLRGIPRDHIIKFLKVKGERFEYEMNMLIATKESQINICEVPIKTIYIDDNESSHFNPLRDSLSIYSIFIKFIVSSISSFIIDIVAFSMLIYIFKDMMQNYYILASTFGARIISSIFNYTINKNSVFKSNDTNKIKSVKKYFTLCFIQLLISAYGVSIIFKAFANSETLVKILVDTILFIISFQIQRDWVFTNKNSRESAL